MQLMRRVVRRRRTVGMLPTVLLATLTAIVDVGYAPIQAQEPPMPSAAELALITERGRWLAGYDAAAWLATDALVEHGFQQQLLGRYVARSTATGWVVAFGRISVDSSAFLVAYLAQAPNAYGNFAVEPYEPPVRDTAFFWHAALAIETAASQFTPVASQYNIAVLEAADSGWFVYFYPAQTSDAAWPHGGDARYLVDSGGHRLLESRQFHRAIINYPAQGPQDSLRAGMHTELLSDVPAETDVLLVLRRPFRVPELVVTENFMYEISVDGTIICVQRREDLHDDA